MLASFLFETLRYFCLKLYHPLNCGTVYLSLFEFVLLCILSCSFLTVCNSHFKLYEKQWLLAYICWIFRILEHLPSNCGTVYSCLLILVLLCIMSFSFPTPSLNLSLNLYSVSWSEVFLCCNKKIIVFSQILITEQN